MILLEMPLERYIFRHSLRNTKKLVPAKPGEPDLVFLSNGNEVSIFDVKEFRVPIVVDIHDDFAPSHERNEPNCGQYGYCRGVLPFLKSHKSSSNTRKPFELLKQTRSICSQSNHGFLREIFEIYLEDYEVRSFDGEEKDPKKLPDLYYNSEQNAQKAHNFFKKSKRISLIASLKMFKSL